MVPKQQVSRHRPFGASTIERENTAMIQSNQSLFYVSSTGKVSQVKTVTAEKQGEVEVLLSNGARFRVSTFNLFNTEIAANRAAIQRLPGNQGGSVETVS